jgi:hypothetical protein
VLDSLGLESRHEEEIFSSTKSPYRLWDPSTLIFSGNSESFLRLNWPWREDDQSPVCSVEVKLVELHFYFLYTHSQGGQKKLPFHKLHLPALMVVMVVAEHKQPVGPPTM